MTEVLSLNDISVKGYKILHLQCTTIRKIPINNKVVMIISSIFSDIMLFILV